MSITAAFDRAADYDRHAGFQRDVAERLAERIAALPVVREPRVLEIGCGTGFLGAALVDRWPGARWTMTDIAPAMVERTRARFAGHEGIALAVMDGERPDIAGPFDLIVSSLAAQWFGDLPGAITRWRALLAPGGRIAFTTLAAGSFAEWRAAHDGISAGSHAYPDGEALAALGLDVAIERISVRHAGTAAFLHSMKAIGAGTPRPGYRPLAPARLRAVMARFDAGGATATYAVATCIGAPAGEEAGA